MENVPSRSDGVWLAGGRLPISADPPLAKLSDGVARVASIRADIAKDAKIATMPPVEVVPYIWTRERALICGRVTALRNGAGAHFGVQLPAPTALCTDYAAVRALLVHEFAHWFYIAARVVNDSELGQAERAGALDLRNESLSEADTQINPRQWFGEEDARRFIQHGDSATRAISSQAIGLEKYFYVITPNLGDTAGGIDINDEVKAHIRRLRVSDAIKMNSERQSQPSQAARSDCFHSRVRASCQKCGRIAQILHLPMKLLGRYCPNCCPVCSGLEPPQ